MVMAFTEDDGGVVRLLQIKIRFDPTQQVLHAASLAKAPNHACFLAGAMHDISCGGIKSCLLAAGATHSVYCASHACFCCTEGDAIVTGSEEVWTPPLPVSPQVLSS